MHGIKWWTDLGEGKRYGLIVSEKNKKRKLKEVIVCLILVDWWKYLHGKDMKKCVCNKQYL